MSSSFVTATAYQVTDLARNHREVVDKARHGGALIRDKDGTVLLLAPAADINHEHELTALATAFVRLTQTLASSPVQRSTAAYGDFAWLTAFEEEYQLQFLAELTKPVLVALSGGPLEPALTLIDDWRVTSITYADEELRAELTRPIPKPRRDLEL